MKDVCIVEFVKYKDHLKSENKVFYSLRLLMSKLQQLLDKHKDKLRMWKEDDLTLIQEYWKYYINLSITWESFSLSDLLFSTQFVSLLDRHNIDVDLCEYGYDNDWVPNKKVKKLSIVEMHKVILALLTTDEERVEYIEENTI